MDTKKHEQKVRLQAAELISTFPNIPPEKIVELATPLSEWILEGNQKLPLDTDDKE